MSKTEDFKRPTHPDFMDSAELRAIKWSGMRQNNLSNCAEVWLLGECKKSISPADLVKDPHAVQKAMSEIFMLDRILPDTPQARAYGKDKDTQDNNESKIILLH